MVCRVSKAWAQRVRIQGKPTYLGLGPYPVVTLAEARVKALEHARLLAKGIDPRTGGVPTFKQAAEHSDGSRLIFPSATGRTMSDNTLSKLLRDNGVEGVPHGFRSSFRDYAAEQTNAPRAVMEAALAHVVGGTEGAYFRSDVMEKRRKLMISWEQYLASDTHAKVVRFPAS